VNAAVKRPVILFLCVQNAGRSQMAAAFARSMGGKRVDVRMGGTEPAKKVHPAVVETMTEVGIDLRRSKPRKPRDSDLREAHVVVTMGCGEACPATPGKRHEEWEFADPEGEPKERVRAIRDALRDSVEDLLHSLGVAIAAPWNAAGEEE
jgi:arsenate reductase